MICIDCESGKMRLRWETGVRFKASILHPGFGYIAYSDPFFLYVASILNHYYGYIANIMIHSFRTCCKCPDFTNLINRY